MSPPTKLVCIVWRYCWTCYVLNIQHVLLDV